jgi:hypothetical protein
MHKDSLEQQTSLSGDSPAKMSPSLADVLVSLDNAVDYSSPPWNLQSMSKPKQSSWRMCRDFYQATTDAISEQSSLKWPTQGIATLSGEFWIRNSSESPSDAEESSLSEVLLTEADPRYLLSAKACEGILRRSNRRGKTLPPQLQEALVKQASQSTLKE